jgi:CHAP domain
MTTTETSAEQLASFQQSHRNHLGLPLKVDGELGAQTQWAIDFATLSRARQAVIVTAQTFLGLEESPPGSNDDPSGAIRDWLSRCSASPGEPWCAAFASRCLGFVRIPSAQRLGKAFPAVKAPSAGDVMWYPTTGDKGHCGIVIGVSEAEVMTIEGNSGNAVRCVRRGRPGLFFARTLLDASGTCPGVVPAVALAGGATR